jgi:hypothetical protein
MAITKVNGNLIQSNTIPEVETLETDLAAINPSAGILAADGLQFPSTQVQSTDANTLDDYEEGTWTPSWTGMTAASVSNANLNIGEYIKIGSKVTAAITFQFGATEYVNDGNALVCTNMPFVSRNTDYGYQGEATAWIPFNPPTAGYSMLFANQSDLRIYAIDPSAARATLVSLNSTTPFFGSTVYFMANITYFV